jgi:prepilin-type N-terminal cleavage/methylation domain-containing protein
MTYVPGLNKEVIIVLTNVRSKYVRAGFTIVELLIVIVVIAILAAISVVAYNGIQERARINTAKSDIANIVKAIHLARVNTGNTLTQITGSTDSRATKTLADSALDAITAASGANLTGLKKGDPWGNHYRIDENEKEQSPTDCRMDSIQVADGKLPATSVPFSQQPCT